MDIATTLLSYGLFSVLAMALVQFIKTKYPDVNILLVLGAISVAGGSIYAVLMGTGLWEIVYKHMLIIGSAANTIYTVLDQILKRASGGEKTLSREGTVL
jgi:hypothetical protein